VVGGACDGSPFSRLSIAVSFPSFLLFFFSSSFLFPLVRRARTGGPTQSRIKKGALLLRREIFSREAGREALVRNRSIIVSVKKEEDRLVTIGPRESRRHAQREYNARPRAPGNNPGSMSEPRERKRSAGRQVRMLDNASLPGRFPRRSTLPPSLPPSLPFPKLWRRSFANTRDRGSHPS